MNANYPVMVQKKDAAAAIDHQSRLMKSLLSGQATWDGLQRAIDNLRRTAPKDHDVVITVGDITVHEVFFWEPHTFSFKGVNIDGEDTWILRPFSQLAVGVVHRLNKGKRIITGFHPHPPPVS
jgi:hypothetical protein